MAKKSAPTLAPLSDDEVVLQALAYNNLNQKAKDLTNQAEEIKQRLKDYLMANGTEGSDRHIRLQRKHAGNIVTLINEARVGKPVLKPEAVDIVKETRFSGQLIETYEGVNLDKLEKLHKLGKLSDDFLAEIFNEPGTSYAFKMKVEPDES